MSRITVLTLVLFGASPHAHATEYAELYFDGYFDEAQALEAAREAGLTVEGTPKVLPATVAVAPVAIDFDKWDAVSPGTLTEWLRALVREEAGRMLKVRLLREGFQVVDTGAEATATLQLDLAACVVPDTKKTRKTGEAGVYPCLQADTDRSDLRLDLTGEGWTAKVRKQPRWMTSGKLSVDRAILGSSHDIRSVPASSLGDGFDEDTDYDITMVLNLVDKALGHTFAVWGAATTEAREASGHVRRVDEKHPMPPLGPGERCFTGATTRDDGVEVDLAYRYVWLPEAGTLRVDRMVKPDGARGQRRLTIWTVTDGSKASGVEYHRALVGELSLDGEPWAWKGWTQTFMEGVYTTYTLDEAGLSMDEHVDEVHATVSLAAAEPRACAEAFEVSEPPPAWPFWDAPEPEAPATEAPPEPEPEPPTEAP